MKMQVSFRRVLVLAVGTALFVAGLGCDQGPVNYDKFEQRTIEANLAAVDSASSIYATLLAAGDIDAAAQQAQAFLLTQEGVDTAQTALVQAMRYPGASVVNALLSPDGSAEVAASARITFPSDQPGEFNTSADGSTIYWMDVARERAYLACSGYVGVGATINVNRCRSDAITGHFAGTLGWWGPGRNPTSDPPSDVITLDDGLFRFTGKVTQGKSSRQLPLPGPDLTGR
jgi:hypothetical protein